MARTKEEQELYERAFEEARERRRGQHEQIVNRTQELLAQRVARDEQARMNAAVQQEPSVSQVQNEAQWPGGIMLPGTFGTNAQNMYSRAFEAPDIAQQTRTQPKSQYEQMNAVKQAWDASDPAATNRVMTALKNSQEANAPENTNRLYRAALLSSPVPDREAADKELSDSLAALSQSTGMDEQTLYSWAERMQNPDELAAEMDYYRQNEAAMRMLGEEEQAALRRAAEKITDAVPINKYTSWEEKKARKEAQELIESTAEKLGISSKSLKNYLQRQNNEENMADVEQTSKTLGAEHPVLSSAGSVVTSLLGRVPSAVDYGVQYLSGKLGDEYLPLDTNTKWQALSRATQEIRGQVSGDLEEAVQDATGSEGLGSAASLVYSAGLSGVDSIAQAALLGGNPILVGIGAGAGAFSDTVTSAKEKGASDSQAMAAGVASGIAESLFEQISLGNLKAMAKVNPKGLRDVVLNFGKSLAVEGSEEAMTEAANIVADAIIMGDVSDYNIAKNAWMEAGSSEDEAEKQALKELIVRVAMAGAGGMIMGAGTSGAGMAYSAANTYNAGRQINQSGNLGELIGQGLSTDATSEAYTQAAQLAQKQLEGARIGNYETGRLANDLAMWRNADGVFMPPLPQNEAQTPGVFHQAAQQRALEEAKVTEEELSAIDRMASDKGLNVEYVYDTASGVDGFIRGNTITVNLASDSASFGTAVHEIGHSMRKANEEQYVKFQNAVLRMAEQDAALSDYANQVRSMYTAQNSPALKSLLNEDGTVNSAALDEEVSLKLAEQIVSDPQKLTEAVSGDRGLMATFLDFVRGIKNSIAIKLTNSQKAMLDEAERTLVNLLRGEPVTWTDAATGKRMRMEQTENGAGFPPTNAEEPAAAVPGAMTEEAVQSKVPDHMQSTEQEDAAWEQYMPNGWQNLPIEQQIALSERAQKRAEQAAAEQPITQQTVKRNTQGKAQRVQASKTNQFVNTVGEALSVPKGARREFLAPIAQQVAQEMKQTGTVSKESADKLFETAYRQGVVVDEEYYNTYKELKDELRTTAVTLDRESRNSAEYKDIRTRYFGSLKMTNDGGTPVDVKYAELEQRYPELFDEELSSPLDQLERLGEVAKSIQKVGYELDAYYAGDEDFKKYSRLAFDDAIEKMRQDMRLVSRYETDRAAQREKRNQPAQPEPMDEQKAMAIYRQAKQLQKNAEKTVSRELLTEEDQHTVERLLKGDMDIRDLKGENSAGIRRVYEAKKAVQDTLAPVQEYNRQKKEALRLEAEKDVEKSDAWKDKGWGLGYSLETMERNIRDIVPDRAEAERIIKKYFVPIHENEAKATRWKNELRQEIRQLKLTQIESEYLQIYGEMRGAEIAARMGHKRSEAELEYLSKAEMAWKEKYGNRMDMGKINRALKVFNKNYDMIFPQMNEAYVRNGYAPVEYRMGYFPHFSDNKPDGLVARIAQRLGFNPTNDNLPTDIAGLTYSFRPGRKWFGNIKQRTGFETTYDAVKGFDRYVETAADVIFHTDDIQRLRALEDALRWRNSAEGVKEQAQAIRDDDRLTEDQKAILLHDLYSKGKSHLSNFVQELNEYTNRLAGKKSIHDRSVEADAGRQIYQTMADLESRVAANMVAVNPGSWLTNFIPITQASAETSTGSLIRAAHDTVKAYLVDDGFADTSTFLTNRRGSDPLSRTTVQKLSSILTKPMTYIDDFTSSVVTRAKYLDNVKAGLDAESAMQDADRFAANIMADRSKGALPTIFERKNPLTRLFTMYQVEVNNQLRYLVKDLPDSAKEKGLGMLIAGLLKYTIGAYLFNDLYELLVGRRPALDFLGIANEAIGDATGYQLPNTVEAAEAVLSGEKVDFTTEKKGVSDAAAGVAENVAESLPFIGGLLGGGRVPISSALPDIATVSSNALGMMSGEKDSESAWQAIGKELAKPAYYLLPPMGGGQIKKAIEGITTVAQGGQYGTDSSGRRRLKFAVDDPTLGTYAQAAIFGPYSLPSAQEYVNSGFKQKSADYTQAREAAKERNISGEQFDEWWNRMDLNADGKVTEKEALTSLPHLNGVADSTKAFLWSQTAGDTSLEGYRAAQDNGVGNEYFQMRMEADQDKPGESGYGSISSTEMKDWLRQQELELDKQAALWKTMATYDQQYDYATAQRQGVGDLYVDLLLNADQLYGDGNGYLNKAEIMAYLDAAQLELDVKRLLFGMVSSAKNPY